MSQSKSHSSEHHEEEEQDFDVEAIVKERVRGKRKEYFVKWLNYPATDNTWEPEENLTQCVEILNKWKEKQRSLAADSVRKRNSINIQSKKPGSNRNTPMEDYSRNKTPTKTRTPETRTMSVSQEPQPEMTRKEANLELSEDEVEEVYLTPKTPKNKSRTISGKFGIPSKFSALLLLWLLYGCSRSLECLFCRSGSPWH